MSDIPGTGKLTSETEKEKPHVVTPLSVVNVSEMKKLKVRKPAPENLSWYDQFKYWLFFGFAIGAIFLLLALVNKRFIILAPLGPIIGAISWFVRKFVNKYDEKTKNFFKQTS